MNLCPDAGTFIELLHNQNPIYRTRLAEAEASGASLHLSSIVLHELMLGAMMSADAARQMERVDELASRFDIEPWTAEDAISAARLRAELKDKGASLSGFEVSLDLGLDALIAGQALARGWTLVTTSPRKFAWVQGLSLIDWAISAEPLQIDWAAMSMSETANLREMLARLPRRIK